MVLTDRSDAVVIFALGDFRFGLSMDTVQRVVRVVEILPILGGPPEMLGVINLHGRLVPVYDIRPRLGLVPREVRVSDHLVIARAGNRDVAVLVDAAVDVVSAAAAPRSLEPELLASLGNADGVVLQADSVVPIHDLSRVLPAESLQAVQLKLVA